METSTIKKYKTYADWEALPEGTRAEFINGNLIMEDESPLYGHQDICMEISRRIANLIEDNKIEGKIISVAMDVHLNSETVVQPDLIFIRKENLGIIKGRVYGVPDMLIEILSPSNLKHDLITKYKLYEASGVQEYFIINPDDKVIICYRLQNKKYVEAYRDVGILKSEVMNAEIVF